MQFILGDMQQGSGSVDPTSNLWSKGSDFSNLSLSTPPGSSNVNGTIGNGSTNGNGNGNGNGNASSSNNNNNNNNTNNDDAEMRMDSNGGDRSEKSQRQRDRHGLGHGHGQESQSMSGNRFGLGRIRGERKRLVAECKGLRAQITAFEVDYTQKYGKAPKVSKKVNK